MKTNSIIGVLAMVSLSFAACEKAENLLPGVDNAQRLANPSIDHAAASMLPHTVFNVPGGETTTYIYDAGKLKSIKNRTVTKQFEYDLLDRLSLVTIINPRAPGEVQVITYEYGPTKNRLPLSAIVRTDGTEDHAQLQRRILFKFNDAGLKISETEFSDELAFEVKHTFFEYDSKNNCNAMVIMQDQKTVSEMHILQFDQKPSPFIQLPVLQLLPGEFAKRNNPLIISTSGTDGKPWVEKHFFEYQTNGWPMRELIDVGGAKKLLNSFSYLNQNI